MGLLILGAGGFGREVCELAAAQGTFGPIAFLDDNCTDQMVVGKCDAYPALTGEYRWAIPAVGDNRLRLEWLRRLADAGYEIPTLVADSAFISPSARLGRGTVVLPQAAVMTHAVVEEGCIINVGAVVDHDAHIGAGCHVCLRAVVKAGAALPEETKLDAGEILRSPWERR